MIIKLADLRGGYTKLVTWLLEEGTVVPSRDGDTVEHTGVTLWFPDPTAIMLPVGVGRGINAQLAAVETLQLISGTADAGLIRRAAPTYDDVLLDPTNTDYAAYGLRLARQIEGVYRELSARPNSRRAVLAVWSKDDLFHDGDRPCTLSLQFLIRQEKLEMHVTMRSQDVWLGTPYDTFMFTQLQLSLATVLGVGVGKYVHHVGSLHMYERNVEAGSNLSASAPTDAANALQDYPRGIVSTDGDETFTDVASYLIDGSCNADEVAANTWYARQLEKIGVTQSRDVTVDG